MSQNNVDFVDEDAWEYCVELNELDLHSNKFQSVDHSTLSGLPKKLGLNGQLIETYWSEGLAR